MKISVALCTFNGEKYITEQLESILNQSRVPDEIIIGDDGSSDATLDLCREVLEKSPVSFRILQGKKGQGITANFSNTISCCTGDMILTCDQDDVWISEKCRIFENVFRKDPGCVLAFSDGFLTDEELHVYGRLWQSVHFNAARQQAFRSGDYLSVLMSRNVVTGSAMAFRRGVARHCLPVAESSYCLHDYWFALNAPLYGHIAMLPMPTYYYRQHRKNAVGARSDALTAKVRRWYRAAREGFVDCDERRALAERYYDINKEKMKPAQKQDCLDWIEFCRWREGLMKKRRPADAIEVLRRWRAGEYDRFFDLDFAVPQDIFSCVLGKTNGIGQDGK